MRRRMLLWLIGGLAVTLLVTLVYDRAIVRTLTPPTPTPAPTRSAPPQLPTFAPFYPCELENVEVHDDATCYNQRVEETQVANVGTAVLILRKEHIGSGCFGSISSDQQALRLCDRRSGATYFTLLDHVVGELYPSPDSAWLAVTTLDWVKQSDTDGGTPALGIYKLRRDGTELTRLDANGLPRGTVGVAIIGWEPDGDWLAVNLWDGSENGWTSHRLKADGSGVIGPLPPVTPHPEETEESA